MLQDVVGSAARASERKRQDDVLCPSSKHMDVIQELGLEEDFSFDPGIVENGDREGRFQCKEDPVFMPQMTNFSSLEAFLLGDNPGSQFLPSQSGPTSPPSNSDQSSLTFLKTVSPPLDPPPNMFPDPPVRFTQRGFTVSTSAGSTNVCSSDVAQMQDLSYATFDPTDISGGIMYPDQLGMLSRYPSVASDAMHNPDRKCPSIFMGFFGAEDSMKFDGLGVVQPSADRCCGPMHPAEDPPPVDESAFKVVRLTTEERKEKIDRFLKKRLARNFNKKIKGMVRRCCLFLDDPRTSLVSSEQLLHPEARGFLVEDGSVGSPSQDRHNIPCSKTHLSQEISLNQSPCPSALIRKIY